MELARRAVPAVERFHMNTLFHGEGHQELFEEKRIYQGHLRQRFVEFHARRRIQHPFWHRRGMYRRHFWSYTGKKIFLKKNQPEGGNPINILIFLEG